MQVTNLAQNTTLTLAGTDTLHLVPTIGIVDSKQVAVGSLGVCPNPSEGDFIVTFGNACRGRVVMQVFDITGNLVTGTEVYGSEGMGRATISGMPRGMFILKVLTPVQDYTGRLISLGVGSAQPRIRLVTEPQMLPRLPAPASKVQMQYNAGERLLLKGTSGNYSRVVTLVPAQSQGVDFEFIDCTDGDGNHYPVVTIGTQTWMAENLRTTKTMVGGSIPMVTDPYSWTTGSGPAYCWYNHDQSSYGALYGALYNWYTANMEHLCPTGWLVPTTNEFTVLIDSLGGQPLAGGAMKETDTVYWLAPNTGATNASGFSARGSGYRGDASGGFWLLGERATWWTYLEPGNIYCCNTMVILGNQASAIMNYTWKLFGYSVRCMLADSSIYHIRPKAAFGISNANPGMGKTVQFTDFSSYSPNSWQWYFGDGDSSLVQNPSHTYLVPGNYTVTLIAGNPYGYDTLVKTNGVVVLSAPPTFPVVDIDGNPYDTVHIGGQVWLRQNLNVTHFNNGLGIPNIMDSAQWIGLTMPGRCYYSNDSIVYAGLYGSLYNWYAVATGNLCPYGWRIPSDTEWTVLTNYLGGVSVAGGPLKEPGTTWWKPPNTGATNASGFSALPGGRRHNQNGKFYDLGNAGCWWTSTLQTVLVAKERRVYNNSTSVGSSNSGMGTGYFVRCIQD